MNNVIEHPDREKLVRELEEKSRASGTKGGNGVEPPGGKADASGMEGRISRLEGAITVFGVVATLLSGIVLWGFTSLNGRIDRLETKSDTKLDAIPAILRDEFRAMRADMAAQTSAIANSVTAARSTPVQVIMVPTPAPEAPTQK